MRKRARNHKLYNELFKNFKKDLDYEYAYALTVAVYSLTREPQGKKGARKYKAVFGVEKFDKLMDE